MLHDVENALVNLNYNSYDRILQNVIKIMIDIKCKMLSVSRIR